MPYRCTRAMKSCGVKRESAERQNAGFSPRKCLCGARGSRSRLVKLQRPPPEMRIFSATFSLCSTSSTFSPDCPAMPAQNSPAAPAPMTTTSKNWLNSRLRNASGVARVVALDGGFLAWPADLARTPASQMARRLDGDGGGANELFRRPGEDVKRLVEGSQLIGRQCPEHGLVDARYLWKHFFVELLTRRRDGDLGAAAVVWHVAACQQAVDHQLADDAGHARAIEMGERSQFGGRHRAVHRHHSYQAPLTPRNPVAAFEQPDPGGTAEGQQTRQPVVQQFVDLFRFFQRHGARQPSGYSPEVVVFYNYSHAS